MEVTCKLEFHQETQDLEPKPPHRLQHFVPDTQLTPRDHEILRDTWLYRYTTAKQLSRLHFNHVKVAQRRLRKLHQSGYLDRFRPTTATKTGFRTWWYRVAKKGANTIAQHHGEDPKAVMPPTRTPKSMGFLAHHALVTDFRIWLREACQEHPERFGYEFVPSYEEIQRTGARQRRVAINLPHHKTLIPDGAFTLKHQPSGKSALFYLEADRGTEPLTGKHPSAIQKKLEMYAAAYDDRAEDQHQTLFTPPFQGFRLLCLVPNTARGDRFLHLAQAADLAPLTWVATHNLLKQRGNLDNPAWRTKPGGELHALSE